MTRKLRGFPKSEHSLIGGAVARVSRKGLAWYMIFAPPTLAYLWVVLYLTREVRPLSRFTDFAPKSAEAVMIDLIFTSAPMWVAIYIYLRMLRRRRLAARRALIAEYGLAQLVQSKRDRDLVYHILRSETGGGDLLTLQLVWSKDGRVHDGTLYHDIARADVYAFNADHFLAMRDIQMRG